MNQLSTEMKLDACMVLILGVESRVTRCCDDDLIGGEWDSELVWDSILGESGSSAHSVVAVKCAQDTDAGERQSSAE